MARAFILFLIISNCFSRVPVMGLISTNLNPQPIESTICRITGFDEKEGKNFLCSGTLISSNEVISAAHCFEGKVSDLQIKCGFLSGKGFEYRDFNKNKDIKKNDNSKFLETHEVKSVKISADWEQKRTDRDDIAILQLENNSAIKPMPLAKNEDLKKFFNTEPTTSEILSRIMSDDYEDKNDNIECKVAGFGITNNERVGVGLSYKTDGFTFDYYGLIAYTSNYRELNKEEVIKCKSLTSRVFKTDRSLVDLIKLFRIIASESPEKWSLASGDSGGALYCKKIDSKEWMLVGVSTSFKAGVNDEEGLLITGNTWSIPAEREIKFKPIKLITNGKK